MNDYDEQPDRFQVELDGQPWQQTILAGERKLWVDGNWYATISANRRFSPTGPDYIGDLIILNFDDFLQPGRYPITAPGPVDVTYVKFSASVAKSYIATGGWVQLTLGPRSRVVGEFKARFSDSDIQLTAGAFNVNCPKPEPRGTTRGANYDPQTLQHLKQLRKFGW